MSRRESFLGRWARLKEEARRPDAPEAPAQAPPPAVTPAPDSVPAAEARAEPPETAEEGPLDLPDVDSLGSDSDYTGFLDSRVPEETQRQALRKLWTSDPSFNLRDGLNEYDEDYRVVGLVGAAVRTAYDVVRGYSPPEDAEASNEVETAEAAVETEPQEDEDVPASGDDAAQQVHDSNRLDPST